MREMKDSGIEWIGEIPEDWKINSMFQLFTQVKNKNYTLSETNLLSLSYGKIKRKNINTTDGLLPQSFDTYNIVQKNDIVLRLTDLQNDHKSLRVGISNEQGIITSAYVTLRNRTNNLSQYLYYYLHSFDVAKGFYGMGSGVRQGLTWDDLKLFKFVIPSQKEQQKISAFLDRKCTEIDSVISKTKATIEEYKKLKQSVITQAVTKGIIPNRPMKDSGIEWIGEIPQEWEVIKMKYLGKCRNGLTYSPDNLTDENNGTLVLRSSNIKDGKLVFTDNVYVNMNIRKELLVQSGDILICSRNGSRKLIGKNAIIPSNLKASFGAFMMIFQCKTPEYVKFILDSEIFSYYLGTFLTATINQLTTENFNNMQIVYCRNENEQQEIVNYLDEKCSEIDKLIAKKEQLLTEMESYKKSLIYECVTGKKEVM